MGIPFWRGIPASLALLKAASLATAFANRDGFTGVASPTGPASAHQHMSDMQIYKKFPRLPGLQWLQLLLMHHHIVIQLLLIPFSVVAKPAARTGLM